MTEAGLNTVNLSQINTWQQVILFLLIIMGSAIFVSTAVLNVRKRAFEIKLQDLADRRAKRLLRPRSFTTSTARRRSSGNNERLAGIASGAIRGRAIKSEDKTNDTGADLNGAMHDRRQPSEQSDKVEQPEADIGPRIRFASNVNQPRNANLERSRSRSRSISRVLTNTGVGAHNSLYAHPNLASRPQHTRPKVKTTDENGFGTSSKPSRLNKYIETLNGYVGRNSQFHNLTEEERKELGGIEYDALCILSWIVPAYFVLFQLIGAVGCGAWLQINRPDITRTNGLNPFWTGAFFAVSAFNNSGMALLDANAAALQTSYYMLLTLSLLILAGNTCFPVFLRLILWILKISIPTESSSTTVSGWKRTLNFILEHPRRVYTNLFPSGPTWWLVTSLVVLNGIDWLAFEILNIGNPVVESISPQYRVLDGLFQAFAVRSGGFYVVAISGLYPGTLVLYVLMMYLSAFPVTMTIRNTNVYEERSLAIFAEDPPEPTEAEQRHMNGMTPFGLVRSMTGKSNLSQTPDQHPRPAKQRTWSRQDFVRQQLRSQLGHDLWLLSLAILFIVIIETSSFHSNPVVFSIFNVVFEVVSAYGCVGISVGVPWNAYSFCGAWHTGSKLILCAVMLRGRHRGLPVAIDRAILLPDESLAWAEEEDATRRRWKRDGSRSLADRQTTTMSSADLEVPSSEETQRGEAEDGLREKADHANAIV